MLGALASALLHVAPAAAADDVHLLVKLRLHAGGPTAGRLLADHGARSLRAIPHTGVRVVSLPASRKAAVLAALGQDPSVVFAEPDGRARPQETVPNDPFFPAGGYALGGGGWGWTQTHTTDAWDVTRGDPSVVVAVLDTGLRPQGLDFDGRLVPGWNVVTGTSDTSSTSGVHGTYVAGAVGLAADTASGNAGYCPGCRVMPVQIGSDSGANYSDMATGITWAADHGARVINLSWAGTTSSATVATAVSYARSKGIVVFAAAGNANCDCPTYPSATPGVLGVAGVSNSGAKAGDSNFGSWVAVAAPEGNMTASPAINGAPGYAAVGGTSLAAPAAAGIAALLFSARPSLTGTQVEQALESSARAVPFAVAAGEVDALAALAALGIADPQAPSAPVNVDRPRMLVAVNGGYDTAALDTAPQVGQVLMRGPGSWTGSTGLSLSAVRWSRCAPDGSNCTVVGAASKYTVQPADSGFALKLTVTYKNAIGATDASSAPAAAVGSTGTTLAPPASVSPPTISGTPQAGQTLTASTGTWSASPTAYTYAWLRCDASGLNCVPTSALGSTYAAGASDVGSTLEVVVTAANAAGSASATSAATAAIAAAPVATQSLSFSGSLGAKGGSQAFAFTAGSGAAHAVLSFSKCSSLTLSLQTSGGTTVATTTGASGLTLDRDLVAGGYRYVVSGGARCSFTLATTTVAP